ncbi:hypothetical protein [Enterovibrio norvegicus]|uniref:hypothetical protein n=1 Tax=Enterovibrio norvegicus TaxID=188144 RepID=UPI000C856904|nr:hypothetical protein [Enterovibrio norvegicus]MCC4796978.1 hypothetical protein [Enterovibrio norvegicus]PMI40714.1 hypothetical protein BCU46_04755 [Enterovibrio norvegicus]
MKTLSIESCQRDLAALDAADLLTAAVKRELERLKNIDTKDIMKRIAPMIISGNITLEALGLPANLFEQIEQLDQINHVARDKLRARIKTDERQLAEMEEGGNQDAEI